VRLQFEGSSEQQSEAFSTLGALNVYNRGNKLVHLRELILRIIDGQTQVRLSFGSVCDCLRYAEFQ
jgi:hypothetical protein